MIRALSIILLFSLINACQPHARFTQEQQQMVTDSVRQTLYNYYADIKRSGLMAELSYLDSSAEFFWVPPGYKTTISYDSVAWHIRQIEGLFITVNNVWNSLRIIPLTKELASYTGQISSIMIDISNKADTSFLIETGLVIKRRDGWKPLNGQTAFITK